jgi:hypothetical protein
MPSPVVAVGAFPLQDMDHALGVGIAVDLAAQDAFEWVWLLPAVMPSWRNPFEVFVGGDVFDVGWNSLMRLVSTTPQSCRVA